MYFRLIRLNADTFKPINPFEMFDNKPFHLAIYCCLLVILFPLFNLVNTLRKAASVTVEKRVQSKTNINIQINTIKYSNRDKHTKHVEWDHRDVVMNDLK